MSDDRFVDHNAPEYPKSDWRHWNNYQTPLPLGVAELFKRLEALEAEVQSLKNN